MSDRLLTDEEINEAGYYLSMVGDHTEYLRRTDWARLIADAASAKSIKVDRQAMVEWMNERCNTLGHRGCRGIRMHCQGCTVIMWELLREGKAPWEEKDAVHTTRKTPRTISPD